MGTGSSKLDKSQQRHIRSDSAGVTNLTLKHNKHASSSLLQALHPDGEPLSYDGPGKLQDHRKQKTHRMVEQAYETGVQQGQKLAEAEAKNAAHLPAGSCAQEPQQPMMARWLYIQAFEDGRQAAKFEHNLVMKAVVDTHKAQLDIVFKHGQDYKTVAGEAPEL